MIKKDLFVSYTLTNHKVAFAKFLKNETTNFRHHIGHFVYQQHDCSPELRTRHVHAASFG
jgi:hypothetical protein